MPLPDLADLTPPYIQGSRIAFVIATGGVIFSGLNGLLADALHPADLTPGQHIQFLITCIYALAGCIVAMAGSGAVLLNWLGKRALKVFADNSKTNRELIQEIKELRTDRNLDRAEIKSLKEIMEVQMDYFNSAGIEAMNRSLDRDPEIPSDLPLSIATAHRRPQQPKTKRSQ
jgi:hypothetical protein